MGMANKPPTATYKRTFYVVSHASNERYRERFEGLHTEHLDEEHLANYIDWSVTESRKQGHGIEIVDTEDGVPGEIVPLSEDEKLWALIKPNTNRRTASKYPFTILTVLYAQQVHRSLSSGRWLQKGKSKKTSQSFTLPEEERKKLEALKAVITPSDQSEQPTDGVTPIKLEFENPAGEKAYRDCTSIKEAEELINAPPQGLLYMRAWVPVQTKEVKRKKLIMEE